MTDPVDFIPAGSATCCCEQASWLGRKAPRYHPHGSFHRSPPHAPPAPIAENRRAAADPIGLLVLGVVITGATCVAVAWAIVHFWPV